jgi:hypothetical protein
LTYPEKKEYAANSDDLIHYYGLCSECFPKVKTQADIRALRAERREREKVTPKKRYRKAYPVVGGPLDGEHAATIDFYRDGMYEHLADEYAEYNRSSTSTRGASMIFVHSSLLKPVVSARER